jgi:hypothetical protein
MPEILKKNWKGLDVSDVSTKSKLAPITRIDLTLSRREMLQKPPLWKSLFFLSVYAGVINILGISKKFSKKFSILSTTPFPPPTIKSRESNNNIWYRSVKGGQRVTVLADDGFRDRSTSSYFGLYWFMSGKILWFLPLRLEKYHSFTREKSGFFNFYFQHQPCSSGGGVFTPPPCVNVILSHDWLMEKRREKRYAAKYYLLFSLSNVFTKALPDREIFSSENYIYSSQNSEVLNFSIEIRMITWYFQFYYKPIQ